MNFFKKFSALLTILLLIFSHSSATKHPKLIENIYFITICDGGKYNVFNDLESVGFFTLEWKLPKKEIEEEYFLTISSKEIPIRLFSNSGESLEVLLFDASRPKTAISLHNLQNFYDTEIPVTIEKNTAILHCCLQAVFFPNQFVGPGIYRCLVDIGIFTKNTKKIEVQTIQLAVEVESSQKISLKSSEACLSEGSLLIDFGEIEAKATKNLLIEVQSNVDYEVTAESFQGGKLILAPEWRRNPYQITSIPYDCVCNGQSYRLQTTPKRIICGSCSQKSTCIDHHFSIILYPDPKQHWEGVYEDEIFFSLQPVY